MQISQILLACLLTLLLSSSSTNAQAPNKLSFFEPADTFHAPRFWSAAAIGTSAYAGTMIGLSQVWYAQFARSDFHFFDDWKEWEKMDKIGHSFTTYQEARVSFYILRWAGLKRKKAMWMAVGMATLFQTSLEVFDGYSDEWGFSMYDIAFNTLGAGLFLSQELAWQEQRIAFKISSSGVPYPNTSITSLDGLQSTTLLDRAQQLYGTSIPERFIKDYNGQTLWLSSNVHSFLDRPSKFPRWLNVAVGYGAENMYGGFENVWEQDGSTFVLSTEAFPRYHQFYLSLDVDLKKIKTKNKFFQVVLKTLNLIKIPAPALEINSLGKWKFHPLHF